MTDHSMLIAGAWTSGERDDRIVCTSPATGETIGTVPEGTRADVGSAVAAAGEAWREWAALSPFERARSLDAVADVITARRDDLARTLTLDQGKPLHAEAYDEVDELIEYFRIAGEDAKRLGGAMPPSIGADKRALVYRVPCGVVGLITPWNWPYTMPAEMLAPALAAGNAVVWVPAPTTAICGVELARCIFDAGIPPGVFNMVTGRGPVVGDELAGHPGVSAVGFIGSISTGVHVGSRAAGKSMLLEMGGNGPFVVLEDADVDAAARASLGAGFLCAGQSCTAGELWLVHEAVHDEFAEALRTALAKEVRLGDPFDRDTTMGPLNNDATAAKVDRHIGDAVERGAEVLTGGGRAPALPTDLYYEATVLDGVDQTMQVATEETFGPVVPISVISGEDEALRIVNSSPYGLLCALWTADLGRALRWAERVDVGWVNINESTNYWESHLPFGGRSGKHSGVGRVGGRYPLDAFTEHKTVIVDLGR